MDAHRQNNFDALRLVGATLVIFCHCWSLTRSGIDPVGKWLLLRCFSAGELGVWMFFAISGYLITASFMARRSLPRFAVARFARIYPAFVLAILYGILVGAATTRLPLAEYLRNASTWSYLWLNLRFHIQYQLPGFPPQVVNGSLWTLPLEVLMYCMVGILGALGLLRRWGAIAIAGPLLVLVVWPTCVLYLPLVTDNVSTAAAQAAPMTCFLVGMAVFLSRPWRRDRLLAVLLGFSLFASAAELASTGVGAAPFLACAIVSCATLWLALGTPHVHVAPAIGDVSYGLYLYGYPTQNLVLWALPWVGPWSLFAIALPSTFVLAWCSWHLLEKRALALKDRSTPRAIRYV